jgi:hypothetical protein
LDLSHPEISISSAGVLVPGAVCLVSFVRGGIKLSVGENGDGRKREELGGHQWRFWREKGKLSGAAKGKIEDEGEDLYQVIDPSHRWIKRK